MSTSTCFEAISSSSHRSPCSSPQPQPTVLSQTPKEEGLDLDEVTEDNNNEDASSSNGGRSSDRKITPSLSSPRKSSRLEQRERKTDKNEEKEKEHGGTSPAEDAASSTKKRASACRNRRMRMTPLGEFLQSEEVENEEEEDDLVKDSSDSSSGPNNEQEKKKNGAIDAEGVSKGSDFVEALGCGIDCDMTIRFDKLKSALMVQEPENNEEGKGIPLSSLFRKTVSVSGESQEGTVVGKDNRVSVVLTNGYSFEMFCRDVGGIIQLAQEAVIEHKNLVDTVKSKDKLLDIVQIRLKEKELECEVLTKKLTEKEDSNTTEWNTNSSLDINSLSNKGLAEVEKHQFLYDHRFEQKLEERRAEYEKQLSVIEADRNALIKENQRVMALLRTSESKQEKTSRTLTDIIEQLKSQLKAERSKMKKLTKSLPSKSGLTAANVKSLLGEIDEVCTSDVKGESESLTDDDSEEDQDSGLGAEVWKSIHLVTKKEPLSPPEENSRMSMDFEQLIEDSNTKGITPIVNPQEESVNEEFATFNYATNEGSLCQKTNEGNLSSETLKKGNCHDGSTPEVNNEIDNNLYLPLNHEFEASSPKKCKEVENRSVNVNDTLTLLADDLACSDSSDSDSSDDSESDVENSAMNKPELNHKEAEESVPVSGLNFESRTEARLLHLSGSPVRSQRGKQPSPIQVRSPNKKPCSTVVQPVKKNEPPKSAAASSGVASLKAKLSQQINKITAVTDTAHVCEKRKLELQSQQKIDRKLMSPPRQLRSTSRAKGTSQSPKKSVKKGIFSLSDSSDSEEEVCDINKTRISSESSPVITTKSPEKLLPKSNLKNCGGGQDTIPKKNAGKPSAIQKLRQAFVKSRNKTVVDSPVVDTGSKSQSRRSPSPLKGNPTSTSCATRTRNRRLSKTEERKSLEVNNTITPEKPREQRQQISSKPASSTAVASDSCDKFRHGKNMQERNADHRSPQRHPVKKQLKNTSTVEDADADLSFPLAEEEDTVQETANPSPQEPVQPTTEVPSAGANNTNPPVQSQVPPFGIGFPIPPVDNPQAQMMYMFQNLTGMMMSFMCTQAQQFGQNQNQPVSGPSAFPYMPFPFPGTGMPPTTLPQTNPAPMASSPTASNQGQQQQQAYNAATVETKSDSVLTLTQPKKSPAKKSYLSTTVAGNARKRQKSRSEVPTPAKKPMIYSRERTPSPVKKTVLQNNPEPTPAKKPMTSCPEPTLIKKRVSRCPEPTPVKKSVVTRCPEPTPAKKSVVTRCPEPTSGRKSVTRCPEATPPAKKSMIHHTPKIASTIVEDETTESESEDEEMGRTVHNSSGIQQGMEEEMEEIADELDSPESPSPEDKGDVEVVHHFQEKDKTDIWAEARRNPKLTNEAKRQIKTLLGESEIRIRDEWDSLLTPENQAVVVLPELAETHLSMAFYEWARSGSKFTRGGAPDDLSDTKEGGVFKRNAQLLYIAENLTKHTHLKNLPKRMLEYFMDVVLPWRNIVFTEKKQLIRLGQFYGLLIERFQIPKGCQDFLFKSMYYRPPDAQFLFGALLKVNSTYFNQFDITDTRLYSLRERMAGYGLTHIPERFRTSQVGKLIPLLKMGLMWKVPEYTLYDLFKNVAVELLSTVEHHDMREEASAVFAFLCIYYGSPSFPYFRDQLMIVTRAWMDKQVSDGVYAAVVKAIGTMIEASFEPLTEVQLQPLRTYLETASPHHGGSSILEEAFSFSLEKLQAATTQSIPSLHKMFPVVEKPKKSTDDRNNNKHGRFQRGGGRGGRGGGGRGKGRAAPGFPRSPSKNNKNKKWNTKAKKNGSP